jgi:hypothetical protein
MPLLVASSAACAQPSAPVPSAAVDTTQETSVASESPSQSQGTIADLPFSQGRSFASLDEYLAFLEMRGPYDVPWYREVRPGLYELVSRRGPGAEPKIYTRDELARKFGFPQ